MRRSFFEDLDQHNEDSIKHSILSFVMAQTRYEIEIIQSKISADKAGEDDLRRSNDLEELLFLLNEERSRLENELKGDSTFININTYSNKLKKNSQITMRYADPGIQEKYKHYFRKNESNIGYICWLGTEEKIIKLLKRLIIQKYIKKLSIEKMISEHFTINSKEKIPTDIQSSELKESDYKNHSLITSNRDKIQIRWLRTQPEIIYLISKLAELKLLTVSNRYKTICNHFTGKNPFKEEILRQSKSQAVQNGYLKGIIHSKKREIDNILNNL